MRWSYEDENIQTDTYEDMLEMKYPYVSKHSRMSLYNRAAQFSPFAALTGYEEAIEETGRLTDTKIILSEESKAELNRILTYLQEHLSDYPEIQVTYFVADKRKQGGSYETYIGRVRRIDEVESLLIMKDKKKIRITDIIDIMLIVE